MTPIRMAQYGTGHSHSAGWLAALLDNPDVELAGVYEPDAERRDTLMRSGSEPWSRARWLNHEEAVLEDATVVAVASEGSNAESLDHTERIVEAGKHVLYDKPAGEDNGQFQRVVETARERGLLLQMGYMFRYHEGFTRIADWARSGFLGHVYAVRANMSTSVDDLGGFAVHGGGVFFDLGGHMLDQIVWILGRPAKVTSFLRRDISTTEGVVDSSLAVFEYDQAMAYVDIAAVQPAPAARRFEVYGTLGSAIMEPFEPADTLRLCLKEPVEGYAAGVTIVKLEHRPRYVDGLAAFIKDLRGEKRPDRSLDHELLVQETLLRATGALQS